MGFDKNHLRGTFAPPKAYSHDHHRRIASHLTATASQNLASLLTLSSGVASSPWMAQGQLVQSSGPLNISVGAGPGDLANDTIDLSGINDLKLIKVNSTSVRVVAAAGATYVRVKQFFNRSSRVKHNDFGQTWNGIIATGDIGGNIVHLTNSGGPINGLGAFSHKYLAFMFKDSTAGNILKYGWVDLSGAISVARPEARIHEFA